MELQIPSALRPVSPPLPPPHQKTQPVSRPLFLLFFSKTGNVLQEGSRISPFSPRLGFQNGADLVGTEKKLARRNKPETTRFGTGNLRGGGGGGKFYKGVRACGPVCVFVLCSPLNQASLTKRGRACFSVKLPTAAAFADFSPPSPASQRASPLNKARCRCESGPNFQAPLQLQSLRPKRGFRGRNREYLKLSFTNVERSALVLTQTNTHTPEIKPIP